MVREVFPDATIIRPAATYGHEDRYFNYYASLRVFPMGLIPMLNQGLDTYKQPLFVSSLSLSLFLSLSLSLSFSLSLSQQLGYWCSHPPGGGCG